MRQIGILAIIIIMVCVAGHARNSALQQAAQAYNDSDYVKCVGLYQDVLRQQGANSAIYYNLGNAYARLENYGAAVLNYRKAIKYNPHDGKARHNLQYIEQKVAFDNEARVADKNLDPTPASLPFLSSMRVIAESLGSDFYAWLSVLFFLIVCAGAASYLFATSTRLKKIGFFGGLASLALGMTSLALSWSAKDSALKVTECVLISPEATLRQSASAQAKEVGVSLCGGTTFRVLEKATDKEKKEWIKLYLNDDFTGWLPADEVEMVKI